nr:hypothetical protein CFP56_00276 [Quercus suber]
MASPHSRHFTPGSLNLQHVKTKINPVTHAIKNPLPKSLRTGTLHIPSTFRLDPEVTLKDRQSNICVSSSETQGLDIDRERHVRAMLIRCGRNLAWSCARGLRRKAS